MKRRVRRAPTTSTLSAEREHARSRRGCAATFAMAVARKVYGFGEGDADDVRRRASAARPSSRALRVASRVWPFCGRYLERHRRTGRAWPGRTRVASGRGRAARTRSIDVRLAEVVGDERLLASRCSTGSRRRAGRALPSGATPAGRSAAARDDGLHVDRDRLGPEFEVRLLLAGEVVVEAVEDQRRDERRGQRDDADERERSGGPGRSSAAAGPQARSGQRRPAPGALSARRRRSRHLGRSGRRPGAAGSSSIFSRRWLTWTLIVFSSWSSAS